MPLDEDTEHATYSADHVTTYFTAATQAALVLTAFRAPFRGRSTPVNAWWGTFDLAAQFFSGRAADPASDDFITRNGGDAEQIEIGWWPGNEKHDGAAFFAFAYPAPEELANASLSPDAAHWDAELGEFVLDWNDIRDAPIPLASPSNSLARPSRTRARSAHGIRCWRRVPRASRRRLTDADAPSRSRHAQEAAANQIPRGQVAQRVECGGVHKERHRAVQASD